ncbi:MAG TPA: aspartate aminotransferase family protein, partial [Actinobacteria bacterium]|nr:aspartate aminotransferase family protein [Actinomycetota bacterium]
LDGPRPYQQIYDAVGETITAAGIGGERALELFDEVLSRACISVEHPRNLSFIPAAPTEESSFFDLVVGASSVYGGTWLEGAGAVFAENQALRWLADLAGFPQAAGGVFVQGGTLGNLSALVTARHAAEARRGARPPRWVVACSADAHSSVDHAARVMDVDVLKVASDDQGRLTGERLREALLARGTDDVFAVFATGGTTNYGVVDDLAGIAEVCAELDLWMHVDGAYGLAALAAPSVRHLFAGIEHADSFIVDPHKWLFAPFDACALLYRDPELARRAHTQKAGYLEVVETGEWNPSDYAVHLSRRARGLPFWFSLAANGTEAYATAVEQTLAVAAGAEEAIGRLDYVEMVRPRQLSVVTFRRIGWTPQEYQEWSESLLRAHFAFVTPTRHGEETVARFAIVNPRTTREDIVAILETMA